MDDASTLTEASRSSSSNLRRVLVGIIALAVVAAAVAVGWVADSARTSSVSASSVDAGFARDMSTHHEQAVIMASYTRDNTTNASVKLLATDIETEQNFQVGEMQGWLDDWGLSRQTNLAQMSWMGGHDHLTSDGLMPGLATQAQLNTLESITGTPMDVLFLQLMIHHHQGGVVMAQYAAQHAQKSYVRDLASSMVSAQNSEIISMEQLLRQLGGSPLPPPST